jgi:hydroxymethylpyrimidine/phosphomethylpyrimidine kinase
LIDHGVVPLVVVATIVVQDSHGVRSMHPVDPALVAAQVERAVMDGKPTAVKLGAMGTAETACAALAALDALAPDIVRLVDPVLAGGTSDAPVMATRALARRYSEPLGRNVILTPNAHELGAILGRVPPNTPDALDAAALDLHTRTGAAVLAKAGHVDPPGADRLVMAGRVHVLAAAHGPWPDVHGTGCHLGSAICAELARGAEVLDAVRSGRRWLADQIETRVREVGSGRPQIVHGSVP